MENILKEMKGEHLKIISSFLKTYQKDCFLITIIDYYCSFRTVLLVHWPGLPRQQNIYWKHSKHTHVQSLPFSFNDTLRSYYNEACINERLSLLNDFLHKHVHMPISNKRTIKIGMWKVFHDFFTNVFSLFKNRNLQE